MELGDNWDYWEIFGNFWTHRDTGKYWEITGSAGDTGDTGVPGNFEMRCVLGTLLIDEKSWYPSNITG